MPFANSSIELPGIFCRLQKLVIPSRATIVIGGIDIPVWSSMNPLNGDDLTQRERIRRISACVDVTRGSAGAPSHAVFFKEGRIR